MTILTHFPHNTYRRYQRETILTMEKAYNGGAKYVVLESPCGSGKSGIAVTIGMHFAPAYLLTSQKVLQTQYILDYGSPYFAELMGRNNYNCAHMNSTCNDGFCQAGKCPDKTKCPYETAKNVALNANVALLNYTYFLYAAYYAKIFKPVNLIVFDEAHSIDRELMSFIEIKFTSKYMRKLGSISDIPEYDKVEDYVGWLNKLYDCFNDTIKTNLEHIKSLQADAVVSISGKSVIIEKIKKLSTANNHLDGQVRKINNFLETREQNEWIHDLQRDKKNSDDDRIFFKPVTVAPYSDEFLFNYGNKHMMMSATILDKKNFCKNLGIPADETEFYQVPSTFPAKNRKTIFVNVGSMSYANIDGTLPKVANVVDKIMDAHPHHKGLIYTHSFKIARYLTNGVLPGHKSRLVSHDGGDRGEALSYFLKHKGPKVMISPSLSEGIDLKDDLARFIIICKIPFGFLGDPQVKRRKEIDPDWYVWKAALTLMQVAGRGVRHKEDWCNVYILDSAFRGFLIRNKHFFPDYFIQSIMG